MVRKKQPARIPVGISSCLLGEPVRYDGAHKRDSNITGRLTDLFDYHPICPEVGIGMGVPREPIQLVRVNGSDGEIRVRQVSDPAVDVTEQLHDFAAQTANHLQLICGYIFKARSPSCGIADVNIYNEQGRLNETPGSGAFAAEIIKAMPNLPVINEEQLQDAAACDDFIERTLAYARGKGILSGDIDLNE